MSYWYDQLVVGGVGGGGSVGGVVPSVLRFLIKSFSMKFSSESLQICYIDSL